MKNYELAIIVISCDKYSDLWKTYFECFFKYWGDCPYPIYLISNKLEYEDNRISNIRVGEDISWSHNLKKALKEVNENNVLLLLEDLFFNKKVNTEKVNQYYHEFKRLNANYLKLTPMPRPDKRVTKDIGEIRIGALYRSTAVFSIWKKEVLQALLKEGENAWEFEEMGSRRSDNYNRFYSTYKNTFSWIHGVIRGKWLAKSIKRIEKEGISIDFSTRGKYNAFNIELFLRNIRHFIFIKIIPSKFRRKIKKLFM